MPTYEIFVNDKPRKIELTKKGEGLFTAKIDDNSKTVQLQGGQNSIEKRFFLNIDGKDYQIELHQIDREKPFQVKVNGTTFKAELKNPIAKVSLTNFAPSQVTTVRKAVSREQVVEGAVTAPMTGKIVSVKVRKRDQVKANQVLCVIEAMKMENEITAPKTGVIREVNVAQGSSVSEGDVLLIID